MLLLRFTVRFFLSFFLWTYSHLFSFSGSSLGDSTNKIVTRFYSFFWQHFYLPIWASLGRTFTLRITNTSAVRGSLGQLTCLIFSSLKIRPSNCLVSLGHLGQSAFSLQIGRLLPGGACQFLHSYEGNLTVRSGCPRGVMVKALDCRIVVSEFVLQSRYYVHVWANTHGKSMNPLILPAMVK